MAVESYAMRFYGTCGHIEEFEDKKLFDQFAAPREATTWPGPPRKITLQNEITTDPDGRKVVHVHPERYFTCTRCINESLASEGLETTLTEGRRVG